MNKAQGYAVMRALEEMLGYETKVADRYGSPIRLTHGTTSDFAEFDETQLDPHALFGPGIYASVNPKVTGGTKTNPGYAKVNRPAEYHHTLELRDREIGKLEQIIIDRYGSQVAKTPPQNRYFIEQDLQNALNAIHILKAPKSSDDLRRIRNAILVNPGLTDLLTPEEAKQFFAEDIAYPPGPNVRPIYMGSKQPFDMEQKIGREGLAKIKATTPEVDLSFNLPVHKEVYGLNSQRLPELTSYLDKELAKLPSSGLTRGHFQAVRNLVNSLEQQTPGSSARRTLEKQLAATLHHSPVVDTALINRLTYRSSYDLQPVQLVNPRGRQVWRQLVQSWRGHSSAPNAEAVEQLARAGYDAITHTGGKLTNGEPHKVWIAQKAKQVLSAPKVEALAKRMYPKAFPILALLALLGGVGALSRSGDDA